MIVAIPYKDEQIAYQFGESTRFVCYEIKNNEIVTEIVFNTNGRKRATLIDILQDISANVVLCGSIGNKAEQLLKEQNIKVLSGYQGNAKTAVLNYLQNLGEK